MTILLPVIAISGIYLFSAAVILTPQSLVQAEPLVFPALPTDPTNQSPRNTSPSITAPTVALNRWNTALFSITNLTALCRVACSGDRFGRGLNPHSCLNAWSRIPPIDRELTFGPRRKIDSDPMFDVYLPKRYLSCESMCMPGSIGSRN